MMILNLLISTFLFSSYLYNSNEKLLNFSGDIQYIVQSEKYIAVLTKTENNDNQIYVINKNGILKFCRALTERPSNIIICEVYGKILISFYDHAEYEEEAYINKLYDLNDGQNEIITELTSNLKLTFSGKYLYNSTHMHDNVQPIEVLNLESNERFVVPSRHWSKVSNFRKNKLIILEHIDIMKLTGTIFKVYDLDKKVLTFQNELLDENGIPIIMTRDEQNRYSLIVDENNEIFIYGIIKLDNHLYRSNAKFFKIDANANVEWSTNLPSGRPTRFENINELQLILGKDKFFDKSTGKLRYLSKTEITNKKSIFPNEFRNLEKLTFGQTEINLNSKSIIKRN